MIRIDDRNIIIDIKNLHDVADRSDWILDYNIQNINHENLTDKFGRYNYKYIEGSVVELTELEKKQLFPELTFEAGSVPTLTQRVDMLESAMQEMILMQMGGN